MYIEGTACWLNHLDTALEKYNNRVHHAMTPFETSNDKPIPSLIPSNNNRKNSYPKLQVGDIVRVPDERNIVGKVIELQNGKENFLEYIKLSQLTSYVYFRRR